MRKHLLIPALLAAIATLPAFAGERVMTEQEKQRLRDSVADAVAFIEKNIGLKAKKPIEMEFTTLEKLLQEAEKEEEKEEGEWLHENRARSELLLKKLGVVPRDFSVEKYATESGPRMILAYYSSETKKLYMLDTLTHVQREAVLVHEVMHAIEDQYLPLDLYIRGGAKESARAALAEEDKYDPHFDDGAAARRAVIEGHASMAAWSYLVAEAKGKKTVGSSAAQRAMYLQNLANPVDKERRQVAQKTPPYLRDASAFAYREGSEYVAFLNQKGGGKLAINQPLQHPPTGTRQVLMPEKYVEGEEVARFVMPKVGPALGPEYKLLRIGTAGQLPLTLMIKHLVGPDTAEKLAPKWRGGVWYLFTRAPGQSTALSTKDVALLYVSGWQNGGAAQQFAEAYARIVAKKYPEAAAGIRGSGRAWNTAEGGVSVEVSGDRVVVMESFEPAAAERLRALLSSATERKQ